LAGSDKRHHFWKNYLELKKGEKKMRFSNEVGQGSLLVSEPFLADPYFKRTVVLLSEYTHDGSIGFILNKVTDIKLSEAVKDFPEGDFPVYFGGPVQMDTLHYIHRLGEQLPGSKQICQGVYWGGDFDILKMMIDARQIKPQDIRFFVGYSGWTSEQLSDELKNKAWIVTNTTEKFAFNNNPKGMWGQVLRSLGNEYAIIANFPENPSLN
jgi:putative transcriptional regulator